MKIPKCRVCLHFVITRTSEDPRFEIGRCTYPIPVWVGVRPVVYADQENCNCFQTLHPDYQQE